MVNMNKFTTTIFSLLFSSFSFYAQTGKILEFQNALKIEQSDTARVDLLNELSSEFQSNDPNKAVEYANQALSISEKVNYKRGSAHSFINIANIHINQGEYEIGLKNYNKALAIRLEIGDKEGEGKAILGIGNVYLALGNYNKSLQYYLKSLHISESLNNQRDIGNCLNNIGAIYYYQKNLEKASEYWKQAITYYEKLGENDDIIACLSNIGNVYSEQNKTDKALEFFNRALKLSVEIGDKEQIAGAHINIGSVYVNEGFYPLALNEYLSALKLVEELGKLQEKALLLRNIGEVYRKKKDYNQAIISLESALSISKQIQSTEKMKLCYEELGNIYEASGDFEKAYKNHQLFMNAKDSLLNEESSKQIAEMQTKYDTEKKEKENQILKQTVDIQDLNSNRQRIIIYSVSALSVLLISLAFFIFRGYKQKQKANLQLKEKNLLIEEKNKIVEEKNKDITDSIRYAKRLQTAILKPENTLTNYFEDGFVLFKPKDIVSGDFYWFEKFGNLSLIAAADCTGHGVPGAFMSIIGCNLLSQAVNEYAITQPAAILNSINKGLTKVLQQKGDADSFVTDGMDIALCSFNPEKMIVEYSGAYNPMWIIRDNKVLEFVADKFPVGAFIDSQVRMFKCHEIKVQKGDMIYMFSDGYADQFGGPLGKKFKYKPLQALLLENHKKSGLEQKIALNKAFESWAGNLEQIDDVLIIGIRI